jgi:hypothetical protein
MSNFLTIDPQEVQPEGVAPAEAEDAVRTAQDIWADLFAQLGEDDWPSSPKGTLGTYWRNPTGQAATYIIRLGHTLRILRENLLPESVELFSDKVRDLLKNSGTQYEEILVELEVGHALTEHGSTLVMEPFVNEDLHFAPNKPKSPDYGFLIDDTFVTVDATVWHWDQYRRWRTLRDEVVKTLARRLMVKHSVSRDLEIDLPWNASPTSLAALTRKEICDEIAAIFSGTREIEVSRDRPAKISWQGMLRSNILDDAPEDPAEFLKWQRANTPPGVTITNSSVISALTSSVDPLLDFPGEALDAAVHSLSKSLYRKKDQGRAGFPFLIAMSLYNTRTDWDILRPVIRQRLWPNPRYKWLSGILEYHPSRLQGQVMVSLNMNPNAEIQAPDLLGLLKI